MSILHAIRNASIDEVEAGGLFWRVRRICSADLAKVGFAAMAMATPETDEGMDVDAMMKRINPKQAADLAALQEATVAAGTMAVGDGEGAWDDLKLVIDKTREDPDTGVLWVGSLPAGVSDQLFTRIMSLSTDGEEAAKRLASFRKPTGISADDRGVEQDVREVASRSAGVGPV